MWLLSLVANPSHYWDFRNSYRYDNSFNPIALNGTGDAGVLAKGISGSLIYNSRRTICSYSLYDIL